MRILAASVLIAEAFVVFFAVLVAKNMSDLSSSVLWSIGLVTAAGCLVLAGTLRHRWGYVAGSMLQLLLIVSGWLVPAMFALGFVFAALWVVALRLGSRVDQRRVSSVPPQRR
jgi:hypothetical protein